MQHLRYKTGTTKYRLPNRFLYLYVNRLFLVEIYLIEIGNNSSMNPYQTFRFVHIPSLLRLQAELISIEYYFSS